jgi:acyl-coenzyme A synthetase/AMP-(fatty) acid ligase
VRRLIGASTMTFSPETGWTDISDAVFFHAARRPDALAIIEGEERVSYGELASLVAAASVQLGDLGIKPREVVGIVMPGTIDHVVVTLALIRVGAVPLDLPMPQPGEVPGHALRPFGVRRAFVATGMTPSAGLAVHAVAPGWRHALPTSRGDRRADENPDEDFYLSFTSGSTGAPKGIVTTRRQWQARYVTARNLLPFLLSPEHPPTLLVIGGMAFSAFFFFLTNQLFTGGPVVLMTGAHHPDRLAAAINEWDDAAMLITPPLARELLARAPQNGVMFPKMRALFVGAAPFFAEEKRAVRARLCANSYEVYGSAATGFLASHQIDAHPESVGRPVRDVEIEIVDKEGNRVAAGRTGHVRCRGPGISQSLYGSSAAETSGSEGFVAGWYYPGDLGGIDGEGFLTLKGRVADVIVRRGVEIYPTDLEEIYLAHPSVREVAVVGTRAAVGGRDQEVVVFAVSRTEFDQRALAELTQHCRRLIAAEEFPDRLFCLAELPKNGNGKVDRPRLTAMAEQALRDASRVA